MLRLEGRAWVRMNWAVSTPYPSAAMAASWVDTGSPFRWRSCIKEQLFEKKVVCFESPLKQQCCSMLHLSAANFSSVWLYTASQRRPLQQRDFSPALQQHPDIIRGRLACNEWLEVFCG